MFVGFSDSIDGYRIWIKPRKEVIRSRKVVFEPECAGKMLSLFPSEENDGGRIEEKEDFEAEASGHVNDPEVEENQADLIFLESDSSDDTNNNPEAEEIIRSDDKVIE